MSYHTFHVAKPDAQPDDSQARRRISTTLACLECRRRKTRCDGGHPCQQCLWYNHPRLCSYPKQARRAASTRANVDSLQARVELLTGICSKLFPEHDPEQLATLSRKELVRLVQRLDASSPASDSNATAALASASSGAGNAGALLDNVSSNDFSETAPHSSAGAESLSALEQAPERDPAADEAQRYGRHMWTVADDVNALSISVRQRTSYVGVSSISAALEVIFKIEPSVRAWMAQYHTETSNSSRRNSNSPNRLLLDFNGDPTTLPPADVGERYIDMYFMRVHPMMPMIDEQEFRYLYLYTNRRDAPWSMLLNIVLALGSLADPTSTKEEHLLFSHRVRVQFSLELFGSGNLFVLQALGLLTGYYLHWLSRPNEANALMGAALRMAVAMGLHREFSSPQKSGTAEIPVETRRRTWWSLVCLDTWASMSTGRPSLGRLGAAITVKTPQIPEQTNNAQYLASIKLLPLVHSVRFCKLATHIQDKLASQTTLETSELAVLDGELVQWHRELPPILLTVTNPRPSSTTTPIYGQEPVSGPVQAHSDCPEQLRTPRLVMYWWYMTLRVLAHRPLLLASALRRLPYNALSEEEQIVVAKCRKLAAQTIEDINLACPNEVIANWNAVWMMYQAVMVPMVSLSLHNSLWRTSGVRAAAEEAVEAWRGQIHTAIAFFSRKDLSLSRKCKNMLQRLYDANCSLEHPAAPLQPQSSMPVPASNAVKDSRSTQALPMSYDDTDMLTSDMNLDEWLQTYDDPLDESMAWNDAIWRHEAEQPFQ